jgi:hypothetical protein
MITHAIVTKVFKSDKDKSGKPFVSKNGKPYWKIGIKTDKTGEDWYSALVFDTKAAEYNLEEGKESQFVFDKGQYNNFRIPTRDDLFDARLSRIEQWIRDYEVKRKEGITSAGTKVPDFKGVDQKPKEDEIDIDAIPW